MRVAAMALSGALVLGCAEDSGGAGGSPRLNGGVGELCAGDADCASGLTCSADPVSWLMPEQC